MTSTEMLLPLIKKLRHPVMEIRERSLQLLVAKFQLGWKMRDELSETRLLIEALMSWLQDQEITMQSEALGLLLSVLKTKTGTYITKEIDMRRIIGMLQSVKHKIEPEALEVYNDVMETLLFLNTVESDDNFGIPRLNLATVTSSESEGGTENGHYILNPGSQSSRETSVSNEEVTIFRIKTKTDGFIVILFPWVELCSSDSKTILLVEDALKLVKSTRRCCRFIRNVFLRDFPPEIFLNRPMIVQSLLAISSGRHGGRPEEALLVLLDLTRALCTRLRQLACLDLIHDANQVPDDLRQDDEINLELERIAGNDGVEIMADGDGLAALRQIPAPIFALDTLHEVLSIMFKSIITVGIDKSELLSLTDLNTCLCLVENLVKLLLSCVDEFFWCTEQNTKTHRDVAHKSCLAMRLLGDLLVKYRESFVADPERCHYRVAWLRLLQCADSLLRWAKRSALPPSRIALALHTAQLDPALQLFYPTLCMSINNTLQSAQTNVDKEFKNKYKELMQIISRMEDSVSFMKNKNSYKDSKEILNTINNSLPLLELHLNEEYLNNVTNILLYKVQGWNFDDNDWSVARSITLSIMAHSINWVRVKFYTLMAEMVKSVLKGEKSDQVDEEKSLALLYDVGILTEICCHGLCADEKEIKCHASDIMVYLLRGRLVLSDSCWWRLLASLLPVMPLLHAYAAHDTLLGQAICKSLESVISERMGVSACETRWGLVRLLFVRCPAVQMDAAHALCGILAENENLLPPKETMRPDILMKAIGRLDAQDFNIEYSDSPSKKPQTTGLVQVLDVLKQDIVLDEYGLEYMTRPNFEPMLDPSLRRSTLQQLAVMLRQQELQEAFLQNDGLKVVVAILRMSLTVDDYLAFPECAISCVSVLNSVCFVGRHSLAKIADLPSLLVRVMLVFPANEPAVLMCAQVLALVAWSAFVLQELNSARRRVPALPHCVTQRTSLPFSANSYWSSSPNARHSSVEWLLEDEAYRSAVRVHWWCAWEGSARVLRGAPLPPTPRALRPSSEDRASLQAACPLYSCTRELIALENATSHRQVNDALHLLESYVYLLPLSSASQKEIAALPWQHMQRFLCAPPASPRDLTLMISLLRFIISYINNACLGSTTMSWITPHFFGTDSSVLLLLTRDQLFPQQTAQESLELTQLQIHIIKVITRCLLQLDFDNNHVKNLLKILLDCLEKIDLKNFHILGYLNELMRCTRYLLHCDCVLSEELLLRCMHAMTSTLAGTAAGGGCKGQSCRLDAALSLLALLRQIRDNDVPVQRWSEVWDSEVMSAVMRCAGTGCRVELRAAAVHIMANLAYYTQLLPQLLQATGDESLAHYATSVFCDSSGSNVVRSAAASLLIALSSRSSPHSDIFESELLEQLISCSFVEKALEIFIIFCKEQEYDTKLEPNIPLSVLDRKTELEVRAGKCGDVRVSPLRATLQTRATPTSVLVAATADVLHNVSAFPNCPTQVWNDQGLYRLLFRIGSWNGGSLSEQAQVRSAAYRTLYVAATLRSVRVALAASNDCLHSLLQTYTPISEGDWDAVSSRTNALLLLGTLITEKPACEFVWRELSNKYSMPFFHSLLQCLQINDIELQEATLYCLTQIAHSLSYKRHTHKTSELGIYIKLYDDLKTPYTHKEQTDKFSTNNRTDDCQPDYLAEEICKVLLQLYHNISLETKQYRSSQDDRWPRLCSCLSSILTFSIRSRQYCVHRQFPRSVLTTLQAVRDHLSMQGKPVDVFRNANFNPVLHTLYWVLTMIDCMMLNCPSAKDSFAEDNLTISLNRLWPWCMMTDQLRYAVAHLLFTFTNNCSQASGCMSRCVGGRSLVGEASALVAREAALLSRTHSPALLHLTIRTLTRSLTHHHCRTIILKSEVLLTLYKLCVREYMRGVDSGTAREAARACSMVSRHADGAAALLALRPRPTLAAPPVRALLMPAVAHAAHHHRNTFLQSPDLLELLTGTLLAGDTAEVVSAARAVWALAANHHKAKLLLKSAGVVSAVQAALLRVQRAPDTGSQRAVHLLTYTNTVLQAA